eukprot:431751-Alexandrium_andersonii.AAC.1
MCIRDSEEETPYVGFEDVLDHEEPLQQELLCSYLGLQWPLPQEHSCMALYARAQKAKAALADDSPRPKKMPKCVRAHFEKARARSSVVVPPAPPLPAGHVPR